MIDVVACTFSLWRAKRCSPPLIAVARSSSLAWCVGYRLRSADLLRRRLLR
jgi:hypothetical protein